MPSIFQADTWCDSCTEAIKARLKTQGLVPNDPHNATRYDSDEYPKWMDEDTESDTPQHCGSHEHCLEAETLPSGRRIGKLLSTTLTVAGVEYVKEYILEGGEVSEWWRCVFENAGHDFGLKE